MRHLLGQAALALTENIGALFESWLFCRGSDRAEGAGMGFLGWVDKTKNRGISAPAGYGMVFTRLLALQVLARLLLW